MPKQWARRRNTTAFLGYRHRLGLVSCNGASHLRVGSQAVRDVKESRQDRRVECYGGLYVL